MRNILIVDDQKNLTFILATSLTRYRNYKVEAVHNGRAALEICRQQFFDVVVADYQLPDITGIDIAKSLMEFSPKTKVILITALSANMILDSLEQGNITHFLEKPFALHDFFDVVEEACQD
jgi:DNA-binding NtrC family response regulator